MTENLFNQNNEESNPLDLLVGENKKFKSVEDLAKGKLESDEYIRTLTARMDELRNDYEKLQGEYTSRESLEELIEQATARNSQRTPSSETNPNANGVNNQPTFDPKQIESLVSSKIQEHETSRKYNENYQTVRTKLREHFGENYQDVLKQNIESLGIDENTVNDMARKTPQVLFKLLGVDQTRSPNTFQTPPKTNQRPSTFAPVTQQRTRAFYVKMRKEQPEVYKDPKTTVQMHKDAQELGDAFFDTDE